MMALELSILTLNIWGIPYISKDRDIRVIAIGDVLGSGNYDIVSLQEVWSEADYQYLKKRVENVLPYAHYFYSGVAGSGLCVFSRFPIVSVFFHAWSVNGYVHRIQHGDWFGGKGVGLCKISVRGNIVHVYAAHLHAEYNRNFDDYMAHRTIQAFDTAQFIDNTRGDSVLQILAGDLNTEPGDLAYRVLLSTSQLIDTYEKTYPNHGTNECKNNSYTDENQAKMAPNGKRIDYIMYRLGDYYEGKIVEYMLPLPERIPKFDCSYSDHEAVYSKIILKKVFTSQECQKKVDGTIEADNELALRESILICNERLKQLESDRRNYTLMAIAVIGILLNMVEMSAPYGLMSAFSILKFFLCAVIIFFVFMASIWNITERHGILSGKMGMELTLKGFEELKHGLDGASTSET